MSASIGVGLADFLEFFFRVGIVGIAVGMVLQRELAIGALELDFSNRAAHAQHFVVVAFGVGGQNKPFSDEIAGTLVPV